MWILNYKKKSKATADSLNQFDHCKQCSFTCIDISGGQFFCSGFRFHDHSSPVVTIKGFLFDRGDRYILDFKSNALKAVIIIPGTHSNDTDGFA